MQFIIPVPVPKCPKVIPAHPCGDGGYDDGCNGDGVDIIDDGVDGGDGHRPTLFDIVDNAHNEDGGGDEKKQDNEQDLISTMLNCDRESEIFLGLNSPAATSSH